MNEGMMLEVIGSGLERSREAENNNEKRIKKCWRQL